MTALGDLLAGPARRWPDRVAVSDGDTTYTFGELEARARAVAAGLDVGPGDRVAVLTEKRAVMVVLILAIWKRGAVYVPLDAADPPGRRAALLDLLRPARVVGLDDPVLDAPPADHATVAHGPGDAAYVVLTAGPLAVENSAGALLAFFGNWRPVLRFTPESRVLSLSPFTVDVSFLDTLLPLSLGAYVLQFRNLPAGAVIRAVLGRERITHLVAVSMLLAIVTGDGRRLARDQLELVLTGAEPVDPAVLAAWRRQLPEVPVVTAYGPPEATVFGFADGRPVGTTRARIAADGELWVGGPQVMRGYLGEPEATARALVEADGTRWFRTGDRCHDDGGTFVVDGHLDPEVRWLAGRRAHLSEIRRAALAAPGVEKAVVTVARRDGRDVVALDVVAADEAAVTAHLRDVLPPYLQPALLTNEVETCQ